MRPILSNALPICEFTSKITDDSVYLIVSFKAAVGVYSANGRLGYLISASKLPQDRRPIVEIFGKFKNNLGFSMSKTGMWQYRVSFALKKLIGNVPKRADYMLKMNR